MPLWSKGIKRSETGKGRIENNLTSQIEDFFINQEEKVSYEIVDDKNWIVNVDGNLHLNQSELDDGKLFFKIGKLSGNLYFNGKHMSPSVIPDQMEGDIIFVPDEEVLARTRGQKGNSEDELDMGLLTKKETPKSEIITSLKSAIAQVLSSKHKDSIDIQQIIDDIKMDWENQDKYTLIVDFPETESNHVHCDIYVHEDDFNVPIKDRKPLKFNAIQKAYYLMVILNKEGVPVNEDISSKNWKLVQKIYSKLPGRVEKTFITNKETNETENYDLGVSNNMFNPNTFKGYFSEIRTIVRNRIPYQNIAQEFAIEGYKGGPFSIQRATDELRKQIVKLFGLEKEFPNLV